MNSHHRVPVISHMRVKQFAEGTTSHRVTRLLAAAFAGMLVWHGQARVSHAQQVNPIFMEALVHLKVMNYDRALEARKHKRVTIAVLYKQGDAKSKSKAKKMTDAFRTLAKKMKLHKRPISAVLIKYDAVTLAADLNDKNAVAIYVSSGLKNDVDKIRSVAVVSKRTTLCGSRKLVQSGKVAVGAFIRKDHTNVVVHLKTAQSVGMDLDATLFPIAEVFK